MKKKRVVKIIWSVLSVIFIFFSVATVANGKDDKTDVVTGWRPISTKDAPSARDSHTAVWTGKEMIIWGGGDDKTMFNTGGVYNPSTDTWRPTSTKGAPSPRVWHTAVWTGKEMIIWGGRSLEGFPLKTGGRYEPSTDTWREISTINAPSPRQQWHNAIWTGKEMIIWGGGERQASQDVGWKYEPSTDTWKEIPTSYSGGIATMAVWADTEMIIWDEGEDGRIHLKTGGRYDPSTDTWKEISATNAPPARGGYDAVWTGKEVIIWGATWINDLSFINNGWKYNPFTDTWKEISTKNIPSRRGGHTVVWTGKEMIIWGGFIIGMRVSTNYLNTGWGYNPVSDTWKEISTKNAPSMRGGYTAVWTGKEMIVWGGVGSQGKLNTGGRYLP